MPQFDTFTLITALVGPLGVSFYCFIFEDINVLRDLQGRHFVAFATAATCAILGAYIVAQIGSSRGFALLATAPSMLGSTFLVDRYIADLGSPVSFTVYFWIATVVAFGVLIYGLRFI